MLRQVGSARIAGKTVVGVAGTFENMLITFTDGTFIHLEARETEAGAEIEDVEYEVGRSDVSHEDAIAAGLFTREELQKLLAEANKNFLKQREATERQEYARLCKKFGGKHG